jgi:activator of HSP90 ATPase
MAVRNLTQTVTLPASPHDVYEALVDPAQHGLFTGASAILERTPGGKFQHYDGSLEGFVVDLVQDKRIVLAWRASGWPEGHFSIAQFLLKKARGGTRLEFSQFGIPSSDFKDISDGWRQYYWAPLKQYLGS